MSLLEFFLWIYAASTAFVVCFNYLDYMLHPVPFKRCAQERWLHILLWTFVPAANTLITIFVLCDVIKWTSRKVERSWL